MSEDKLTSIEAVRLAEARRAAHHQLLTRARDAGWSCTGIPTGIIVNHDDNTIRLKALFSHQSGLEPQIIEEAGALPLSDFPTLAHHSTQLHPHEGA